jgi:hypothetical protein
LLNKFQMYKVVDNFFEDPYEVRQIGIDLIAKKHSCILNDSTNYYPGIRCSVPNHINTFIISFLEKTFNRSIKNFCPFYHITSAIHGSGLIHYDADSHEENIYAGLIYLNENPPEKSGTILCNEIDYFNKNTITNSFNLVCSTHDVKIISEFEKDREKYNRNFEIETEIENKFNRLLIYKGNRPHAPYYYFGNNLFNSRLILVFLFNLV